MNVSVHRLQLMIVVIMTVVGLGMITFMAHKEKNE